MKRHALDPVSLVAGVVFLCLGLVGASGALASLEDLRLVGPLALLGLGGLLVASAIVNAKDDRDRRDAPTEQPIDAPTEQPIDEPIDEPTDH